MLAELVGMEGPHPLSITNSCPEGGRAVPKGKHTGGVGLGSFVGLYVCSSVPLFPSTLVSLSIYPALFVCIIQPMKLNWRNLADLILICLLQESAIPLNHHVPVPLPACRRQTLSLT